MRHERLGWGFIAFCVGLALPTLALLAHLAFALSDWTPLNIQEGNRMALAATGCVAIALILVAHWFSRAGLLSAAGLCAGLLVALEANILLIGGA